MVIERSPVDTLVYKYNEYSTTATDAVVLTQPHGTAAKHNMLHIVAPTYGKTEITSMNRPTYVVITSEKGVVHARFLSETKQELGEMHVNIADNAIASQMPINAYVFRISENSEYNKTAIGGIKVGNDSIIMTGTKYTSYAAYFGTNYNNYTDDNVLVGDNPFAQSSVSQDQIDDLNVKVDQCIEDVNALKPLASEMKAYYVSR